MCRVSSPSSCSPLLPLVFKINFDGAAKGNPRVAGFGGVYKNLAAGILQVYHGSIGFDTNNSAELEGLLRGISLMIREGWLPSMMEGDSNILIQMAKQLANGEGFV